MYDYYSMWFFLLQTHTYIHTYIHYLHLFKYTYTYIQDAADINSGADIFSALLSEPDLWRKMMSTGGCWFIYDIAYCTLSRIARSAIALHIA